MESVTQQERANIYLFLFLRNKDNFKAYFKSDDDAVSFYKNFRCGILHQAQTSSNTKIWTTGDLIFNYDGYTIVNRDLYHTKLKEELNIYRDKILNKSDKLLLDNLKKKMDFISNK